MEHDFGSELTKQFGARLKRLYELDERALPTQIAVWVERLQRAEEERAARAKEDAAHIPARG